MKTVKVTGLVLKSWKFGEADHLLSLFTPELGKISAIAKGSRKIKGSMRGKTQPFVYGNYLLYRGKNLYTVTQAEIIYSFGQLGNNVEKYGYACYVCELTDLFLENEHPVPQLFTSLLGTLHAINLTPGPLLIPWFRLQLLKIMGYEPQLGYCVSCGSEVKAGQAFISKNQGGIFCDSCAGQKTNISGGARAAMVYLLRTKLEKIWRLKLTPVVRTEVESQVEQLVGFHLHKPLKSEDFLRCIKKD